jgi:hypothetical protein
MQREQESYFGEVRIPANEAEYPEGNGTFASLTTLLNGLIIISKRIRRELGPPSVADLPALRLSKGWYWSAANSRSDRRGFRTLSAICLLDTQKKQ